MTPMQKLTRDDLLSLEAYAEARAAMRAEVMAHKALRRVDLGAHVSLFFEDRLTMRYQVQEMLRAERIFEADGIEDELEAYNPLIPDGSNWKATMMIQYTNVAERQQALARLVGIENAVWVRVGEHDPVRPVSDEDLERSTEDKTSSVHFLRFELSPEMVAAAKRGAPIAMGVDHAEYSHTLQALPPDTAAALAADLA